MADVVVADRTYAKDECWSASCRLPAEYLLKTRVLDDMIGPYVQEIGYCYDCAKYFAHWLVFCYTGDYEILDIRRIDGRDCFDALRTW